MFKDHNLWNKFKNRQLHNVFCFSNLIKTYLYNIVNIAKISQAFMLFLNNLLKYLQKLLEMLDEKKVYVIVNASIHKIKGLDDNGKEDILINNFSF